MTKIKKDDYRESVCAEIGEVGSDNFEYEDVIYCYHCDAVIEDDDYYDVNTRDGLQTFCPDCYDDKCFCCPDCEENYLNDDARIEYRGSSICRCCSDNYCYCERCDSYVHYDDYDGDRECCCNCVRDRDTGVEDYHASSCWDFIGECKPVWKGKWRGIGIELEIDRDDDDTDAERETVSEIREIYGNLKFEHDGSLEHGFEIITHPHTVDEFYNIDWASILKVCKANGYTSHSATHCGLHIHFSRTMFGATEKQQANSISKLINFFERFWNDIIRVSRRTQQQTDDYAGKYGITDISEVKKLAKKKDSGRYFAVNNTNCDTVEIRIMRGTLNLKSFLACIDFCITVVKNSRFITWNDITETDKWLKGMKPETRDYVRSREAFEGVA
jgi:hypothetical protein